MASGRLFSGKLVKMPKKIFGDKEYDKTLAELVGKNHGVYALYKKDTLYYVGKASDLRSRIKRHLKSRRDTEWTHFSLYLTKKKQYMDDIESIVVTLARPKGNKNIPKGKTDARLRKRLEEIIDERHKNKKKIMLGLGSHRKPRRPPNDSGGRKSLKGLVSRSCSLYGKYKGRTHQAKLMPSGKVMYKNKEYDTPSAAGRAVTKYGCNGWAFWKVKDRKRRLVSLASLMTGRGPRRSPRRPSSGAGGRRIWKGLVPRARSLYAKYKGKPYSAKLMPSGKVMYKNKEYDTPSAAGRAVMKHGCDGPKFWKVKDENGYLVPLGSLR